MEAREDRPRICLHWRALACHLLVCATIAASTLAVAAHHQWLAVFSAVLATGMGAVFLVRATRPFSELDGQLRRIALAVPGATVAPEPLRGRTGAELGWNRLTMQFGRGDATENSLGNSLAALAEDRKQGRLAAILNGLPDGIAATDAEGRIQFVNSAFPSILGLTDEDEGLLGDEIAPLMERAADNADAVGQLAAPEANSRTVVVEVDGAGRCSDRVLRIARIPIRAQQAGSAIWLIRDATQQKLAERMRNEFIDTATHELRTPLANIKAYAETLSTADAIDLESQREFSNTINSEATRLARFVDDLLSISSMEVGSLTVDRQSVETERLLREAIDKVRSLFEAKGVTFECTLPPKMPELLLDKDKISTALVNLLGNAAKYTPQGGTASLQASVEDGALEIEVTDSGVGISEEELPRIFDKFFRSADSRVQDETGTGLGLSLAREVVRLHGGSLTATSQLNQGSTFLLTLPIA